MRRVNDVRVTALGMVGEEAEEVATPEQVMKLASAIEPIWRIPIATSPCPARAWRHYPEVRRSPRLSAVSLRRSTRRAQRPAGAQAMLRLPSSPIQHPSRAFCGCGAAVRVFGAPIRSLWLAANWFKFPRAAPSAGMVAVRRHHVFVLEAYLGGDTWQVYDANSRRHQTRIHARSIAGYVIVNPLGGSV